MQFFNHVNFNKVEIRQASIQPLSAAPSGPVIGQIYFDTVLGMLQLYNGSTWTNLSANSQQFNGQAASFYLARANHTGTQSASTVTLNTGKLLGRTSTGTGGAEEITVSSGLTLASGSLAMTNMPANTLKGNNTGVGGSPLDLTTTQVRTLLTINNVDNTSDANKPISTATQSALDGKQALNASLSSLAGLSWSAGVQIIAFNGVNALTLKTVGTGTGNILDKASGDTLYLGISATATNASQLAGQSGAFYLARANHTGTQTASTISDLATTVKGYRLDEFAVPTAAISVGNQKITSVATPTSPSDAATYQFVLDQIQASSTGISVKTPVRVVAKTNIDRSTGGLLTIDSVTLVAGDRVLLVGQTDATQNGVYIAAVGSWTRATTEDETTELKGAFWLVNEGTVNAGTQWIVNNSTAPAVGTDPITIVQFGAVVSYTASNGVQKVGNDFRAQVVAGGGVSTGASGLQVDTTVVARKFSTLIGDAVSTSITVTHNLGTQDVVVSIRDASTNSGVFVDWIANSTSQVTISFLNAPASNAFRITVIG
jgi:hypothetical protein